MPKIPHRIFEIYESREEATQAMTPKVEKAAMDSSALSSWQFEHLIVSRSAGVTHVRFTAAKDFEEATVSGLRRDFAQLADTLGIDSKVLVDFTGVELFSTPFIDALVVFSRQLRTNLLGLLFLGSAASLVYYLIMSPTRTPMVAAVALDYRWPLPPNAWAREDLDGLTDALGSETVSMTEVALQGPSSLEELVRQLVAASGRVRSGGTVMVYVSAHAAVDGAGEPCLLLPESDPLDSTTWFRLSDLLTELKSIQQRYACRHLLILDTHRQHTNWSIGLLDDLSQRMEATVRQAAAPNLVVLNSASSGQVSWTSLPLQGSIFGYWLRYGLAGEADANGDGQVGCRELVAYLQRHVDRWAQTHRASRQTPRLIPADAPDFPLTWTFNPRALSRLRRADDSPVVESGSLSGDRMAWLWNRHDELAKLLPRHYAPHRWQQIQHDLLWLEQATLAGSGYREAVERMGSRLEGEVSSLLEQVRELDASAIASPIRLTAALTGDRSLASAEMAAGTPPLTEYLGLPAGVAPAADGSPLRQLVTRHHSRQLWPDDQVIDQVLELHDYAASLAVPRALQDVGRRLEGASGDPPPARVSGSSPANDRGSIIRGWFVSHRPIASGGRSPAPVSAIGRPASDVSAGLPGARSCLGCLALSCSLVLPTRESRHLGNR
jgi:hypothetical protein